MESMRIQGRKQAKMVRAANISERRVERFMRAKLAAFFGFIAT
jgi:hypothetical protein